jgi:hypothetical protein
MQYDQPRVRIPCGATDSKTFENGFGGEAPSSKIILKKIRSVKGM